MHPYGSSTARLRRCQRVRRGQTVVILRAALLLSFVAECGEDRVCVFQQLLVSGLHLAMASCDNSIYTVRGLHHQRQ